jgi:fluoroquinolone transport system permease protein
MKQLFTVLNNDLRLIFRDKSLLIMFFLPLIIVLLCREGVPYLTEFIPQIPRYYWIIVAGFTSVTASTPSFLLGFIILDERDENIHNILRILPLPQNFILKSRILFIIFLGFIFSLTILIFNGLVHYGFFETVALAVLFSFIPPVLTFAITAFARNKIEAATMYKGLSLVLILPVIAFFVDEIWKYFFGIIPFFWTFEAVYVTGNPLKFLFSFMVSFIFHSMVSILLYRIYCKKNV